MQWGKGRALGVVGFVICALMADRVLFAQPPSLPQNPVLHEATGQLLSPEQLNTLVAPIALYPDGLLGQILAASTYPLELVETQQWLEQHPDLHGSQLITAAKQLNCDASVQAMVAFPDVLRLLTQNVRWTTDLGNAFLAQQAGVMDAIQRLRGEAQQSGHLASTPGQVVTTQPGPVQNAI